MNTYIDGFVFPIPSIYLEDYKKIAIQVAEIWKSYGALAYVEYVSDDMYLEGTKSFLETIAVKENESVVFGWVIFSSKKVRDIANQKVPNDPRMEALVAPLVSTNKNIFDASRMVYGGFKPLIISNHNPKE